MSELYIYPSENDNESDYSDNMNEFDKYEYKYDNDVTNSEFKIDNIIKENEPSNIFG